jgi:hypothetical protein
MKTTVFTMLLGLSLMFQSCEKKQIVQPTELPQALNYLEGNWKVVKYYIDSYGGNATGSPDFDELRFSKTSVALFLNDATLEEQQFNFSKEGKTGIYRISFAGRDAGDLDMTLDHYVSKVNDTLCLSSIIFDGGIDYWLVKE